MKKYILLLIVLLSSCTYKYNENDIIEKAKEEIPLKFDTSLGTFEIEKINSIKFSEEEQRIFINMDAKLSNSKFDYFYISGKPVLKENKIFLTELRAEKVEFIFSVKPVLSYIFNNVLSEIEILEISKFKQKLLKSFYIKDESIDFKVNIF